MASLRPGSTCARCGPRAATACPRAPAPACARATPRWRRWRRACSGSPWPRWGPGCASPPCGSASARSIHRLGNEKVDLLKKGVIILARAWSFTQHSTIFVSITQNSKSFIPVRTYTYVNYCIRYISKIFYAIGGKPAKGPPEGKRSPSLHSFIVRLTKLFPVQRSRSSSKEASEEALLGRLRHVAWQEQLS